MKRSIVQQIAELPPKQQEMIPDIKVELEPVFEVTTPAPDMTVLADAIQRMIDRPQQPLNITVMEPPEEPEPPKVFDIEVTERDTRGGIKKLRLTEVKSE